MPPPQYFRRSQTYKSSSETPDIFRLWLLRMLVPLGAHREFITQYGFKSDALAELLGLGRWVEGSDDTDVASDTWSEDSSTTSEKTTSQIFEPKRVRSELRRLHRAAERKASARQLPQALRSNLERLASLVGLSAVDVSILEFAVMINSDGLLVETSEWLGNLSTVKLIAALSVVQAVLNHEISNVSQITDTTQARTHLSSPFFH